MDDSIGSSGPQSSDAIWQDTVAAGFTMPSDHKTGSLLCTLAASRPRGRLLELGTGTGLSAAWLLDGMDADSTLDSVDNGPAVVAIAHQKLRREGEAPAVPLPVTNAQCLHGSAGASPSQEMGQQYMT